MKLGGLTRLQAGQGIEADRHQPGAADVDLDLHRGGGGKAVVGLDGDRGLTGITGLGGEEQGFAIGQETRCSVAGTLDAPEDAVAFEIGTGGEVDVVARITGGTAVTVLVLGEETEQVDLDATILGIT